MRDRIVSQRSIRSGHDGLPCPCNAEEYDRSPRTGECNEAKTSCVLEDDIDSWLVLSGAPQAVFHRCPCGCRFRWPTNARRIETRVEDAIEEAVELAYCPACKSVRLRLLAKPNSHADRCSDIQDTEAAAKFDPDSHTRLRAGVERQLPDEAS